MFFKILYVNSNILYAYFLCIVFVLIIMIHLEILCVLFEIEAASLARLKGIAIIIITVSFSTATTQKRMAYISFSCNADEEQSLVMQQTL